MEGQDMSVSIACAGVVDAGGCSPVFAPLHIRVGCPKCLLPMRGMLVADPEQVTFEPGPKPENDSIFCENQDCSEYRVRYRWPRVQLEKI